MNNSTQFDFGSVKIVTAELPSGVTTVRSNDHRVGRLLHMLFPIDGGVIVRSTPGTQDMVGRSGVAWLRNWQPYSLYVAAPCKVISMLVPDTIFDACAAPADELPVVAESPSSLLAPVREFLISLTASDASTDRLTSYLTEKLLTEMTLSMLLEVQGIGKISASAEQSLHARAIAHIAAYKSDPTLTPAHVAQNMNISLRQLQRAFAARGSSITDEIRRQRVESAVSLLADAAYRHLDLTQIAQHAGFGGAAELRRAVVSVHNCTPSQLRATA